MSYSSQQQVLDLLREPFFWKIFNTNKEKRYKDLWNLFEKYNNIFSKYEKSIWHSKVLSLAERYMQETDEWRFLDFFKTWDTQKFLDDDWKEVKKDGNTYKPLAIICLKKAFEIIKKEPKKTVEVDWLIEPYEKANGIFPEDEWLLRERALLLIRINDLKSAIDIYKKLVLELCDKAYIWSEFASCFNSDKNLRIGMLSKAIQLEQNEDFLGDIHIELAETLINHDLIENAVVELITYKKHREYKGWRLSEKYNELLRRINNSVTELKDNKQLYGEFIPFAEKYAYEDLAWDSFVLFGIWRIDENKEKCNFSNGKEKQFSISKGRFDLLSSAKIGNVFDVKTHVKQKEIILSNSISFPMHVKKKIEYEYIPVLIYKSIKDDWSILDDEFAVVEYINREKNIIHLVTTKNEESFFREDTNKFSIGDIVKGKLLLIKIKDETRIELKQISKVDKSVGLENFNKYIVVIDNVNQEKKLFHFVANKTVHGIIRYNETDIRPKVGDCFESRVIKKKDIKHNKTICRAIEIRETEHRPSDLVKTINGTLELKYKRGGSTVDYYDLDEYDILETNPDFGFIDDYYVPKNLLAENNISSNCTVSGTAIFSGDKWKVIQINKE